MDREVFDPDRTPAPGFGTRRAWTGSLSFHLLMLTVLLVASFQPRPAAVDADAAVDSGKLRWLHVGEHGAGDAGGGGEEGDRATAAIPGHPRESAAPRRAPIVPRRPRPLNFDDLNVPDLPQEAVLLFDGVFSPDALEFPGLSPTDPRDWGGFDTTPSSGRGGGIGDGDGPGVGPGQGPGVGPGVPGGRGWDTDPVPVYKPPDPAYPSRARQQRITGEVILRVLVKLDGSTEVVGVVKSLPHCVDAAVESAKLWRWKPARRNGKPVEAFGIITVTFDLFAQA